MRCAIESGHATGWFRLAQKSLLFATNKNITDPCNFHLGNINLFTECVEGARDVIEVGEQIGDEYVQPEGYIIVPLGNLTDLDLPTDAAIEIPQ